MFFLSLSYYKLINQCLSVKGLHYPWRMKKVNFGLLHKLLVNSFKNEIQIVLMESFDDIMLIEFI